MPQLFLAQRYGTIAPMPVFLLIERKPGSAQFKVREKLLPEEAFSRFGRLLDWKTDDLNIIGAIDIWREPSGQFAVAYCMYSAKNTRGPRFAYFRLDMSTRSIANVFPYSMVVKDNVAYFDGYTSSMTIDGTTPKPLISTGDLLTGATATLVTGAGRPIIIQGAKLHAIRLSQRPQAPWQAELIELDIISGAVDRVGAVDGNIVRSGKASEDFGWICVRLSDKGPQGYTALFDSSSHQFIRQKYLPTCILICPV